MYANNGRSMYAINGRRMYVLSSKVALSFRIQEIAYVHTNIQAKHVCMYVLGGGSKWATPQAVLGEEGSSFKKQRFFDS